jgi:hypothetical protein
MFGCLKSGRRNRYSDFTSPLAIVPKGGMHFRSSDSDGQYTIRILRTKMSLVKIAIKVGKNLRFSMGGKFD